MLTLEVRTQLLGTGNAHLAGREVRAALRERGDLGGLAARCRAHVEHVLAGSGAQHERRHHGREALQVDLALAVDVEVPKVGDGGVGQDEGVRVPGDGLVLDAGGVEGCGDLLGRGGERVGAQCHGTLGGRAKALDDALGILGPIGAGHGIDHKARQIARGLTDGKLIRCRRGLKCAQLERSLDLFLLFTATRLWHIVSSG